MPTQERQPHKPSGNGPSSSGPSPATEPAAEVEDGLYWTSDPAVAGSTKPLRVQAAWLEAGRLQGVQRRSLAIQLGRAHGNQHVQQVVAFLGQTAPRADAGTAIPPPRQPMRPGTVAASWTDVNGPEWSRYHELRTLLEREVTPGTDGRRYQFEELDSDRFGPTRWRVTPPTRLQQELMEASPQEIGREDIIRRLERWVARERRSGHLPSPAAETPAPQLPPWLASEARRFIEQVRQGLGVSPGDPTVHLFGPTINIERPYLGAVGATEEPEPGARGITRISTPSQVIWVHWVRGGAIHLQAMRFAPVDRVDSFYSERDYDTWQDWNYQMFRFVVEERMSIEQAYAQMHAIDMETIRQMLSYAAVSRA